MDQPTAYQASTFNQSGLKVLTNHTLELHFKLHDGHVKETDNLNGQNRTMSLGGQGSRGLQTGPGHGRLRTRLAAQSQTGRAACLQRDLLLKH
jgi:hypothetical protein